MKWGNSSREYEFMDFMRHRGLFDEKLVESMLEWYDEMQEYFWEIDEKPENPTVEDEEE